MGIQLGSNFSLQTNLPIDERMVCSSIAERDSIPMFKRYEGLLCYVEEEAINYQLVEGITNEHWQELKSSAFHVGPDEPEDKEKIWFDSSDETVETMKFPVEETLTQFRDTVSHMNEKLSEMWVDFQNINGGDFTDEGFTSDSTEGGNVQSIQIKNGLGQNLRQLRQGELAYCSDTNKLYIGARTNPFQETVTNVCIASGDGGGNGSGNLTGDYLDLTAKDGNTYRVTVADDGNLRVFPAKYYTADDPAPEDNARYKGLIINRVFGGGKAGKNGISPISHGFIELYNNNSQALDINLKGLSLHYRTKDDSVWEKIELHGVLPYQHSYLIRCARHTEDLSAVCRHSIKEYDLDWSQVSIDDGGFMVYLGIGRDVLLIQNPYNYNHTGFQIAGYIDMFVLGKEGTSDSVNAYEGSYGYYHNFGNYHTGAQRIDFKDKNNSYGDIEAVDYSTCNINIYRPRSTLDGAWDLYYNKIKLNERIPNMMNICYGKTWSTRTFTWQSAITDVGYLRYRKLDEYRWNTIETEREMVRHHDQDCIIHRVFVRDLEPGVYEYQAGEEGAWSDISTFEVIEHSATNQTDRIKFLQVSDQQGFYESEYDAWKWAIKYIEKNDNDFEWVLNSGDISQNANRSFEWRYYYHHASFNREKCHMICCGNNDLVDKMYSYAFKYYLTVEDEAQIDTTSQFPVSSCHSWDLGFVHFISVNTNVAEDENLFVNQMKWVKEDVEAARARTNPPRWFIMYAHHGAFTVCRMKMAQQMVPFLEDLEIDVLICGHHHSYSRSKPVRMNLRESLEATLGKDLYECTGPEIQNFVMDVGYVEKDYNGKQDQNTPEGNAASEAAYVDEVNGVYYIMCQSTGYKLQSNRDLEKTPTPWWYGFVGEHPYDPSYIMWDIGWDEIKFKSKSVLGVMEFDERSKLDDTLDIYRVKKDINLEDLTEKVIDELTIPHRSNRTSK